ncbi:MAG: cyclic nucleotide-binding domain-containing protein [Bdellovibrionales bacterium]|nr:cyclic nucleotide-binding domain-containing protein [Bdellovibrionales bacterium]
MYTLLEIDDDFNELAKCLRDRISSFFEQSSIASQEVTLPSESDVYGGTETSQGFLYLLKQGRLSYELHHRSLFSYEEGDLVGLDSCLSPERGKLKTDFAVIAEKIDVEDLLTVVRSDDSLFRRWIEIQEAHSTCLKFLMERFLQSQADFHPEVIHYEIDDVILREGEKGDKVYTLAEGHAEVTIDGVKVGEVLSDEIFGAIASLTGTTRSATVTATQRSVVLTLPAEQFVELIQSRPFTVQKLVEGMARKIIDLNKQVVGKSRES